LTTPDYISPKIRVQIEEKLFSIINFKGRRAEEVKKTVVTAALTKDSVENKAKEFGISPQTVRNYVEERPQVIDQMLNVIKTISVKELGGRKRVKISIDWTSIEYKGKPVEGLGGSEKGYAWNYATATTRVKGKTLILAFTRVEKGMTRLKIVESLIQQILALGLEIELVTLDAGFYSVDVINYLSRFNFIIGVPVGKIGIHRNFDGDYTVKSNGKKATFRLIVHQGREKEYLAKGTNLDVNRSIVVKWYDKVRTPIETSYKLIKSFLIFTSSRSWLFRLFIFVLAMLIYTLYLLLKGTTSKEDFRLLLTILLLQDNITILQEYLVKLFYSLFNSLELFSG
jgi:IS4 transposase